MARLSFAQSLYRWRDAVALMPTVLVLIALIGMGFKNARAIRIHDDNPVEVQLTEPAAPPAPPEPPKPEVVKHVDPVPPRQVTPISQAAPTPVATTTAATANVAAPEPTKPAAPQPDATPAPAQNIPPSPVPAKVSSSDLQSEYAARLKAQLNAMKRYPTGREASQLRPKGVVTLWFVLKRDGSIVESGIEESSNSSLLDEAARKTLNRASFPAFPDQTWSGESTHRFVAELNFIPPN